MNLSINTVLITGGTSGIGLALAERFMHAGSLVIICGRRKEKLNEINQKYPAIITKVCDVAVASERIELFNWIKINYPKLNVLINNAGIQRRINLVENVDNWEDWYQEIAINVEAPIHLSTLFIPLLLKQNLPYIINVSSGLAFAPAVSVPVYSATKAAIHSFTKSLRQQLLKTNIKVVEIIPPAVNTDLGGPGLHTFGVPLNEFADATIHGIEGGKMEVAYGTSERGLQATQGELEKIFIQINTPK